VGADRPYRESFSVEGLDDRLDDDGTYDTQPGFETKTAALSWGRAQEAKLSLSTPAETGTESEAPDKEPEEDKGLTVDEWIDTWESAQDVGISTEATRKSLIKRFIRPKWGSWQLTDITTEEVNKWEKCLPAAENVAPRTASDARSLLCTILGDAAAARPPRIEFNPALRPRNRGKKTGRRLLKSPPRTWATPLEALLIAERAALLSAQAAKAHATRCPCASEHDGSGHLLFRGPDGGHHRRSNYGRRVFRPACDGRYRPENSHPGKLVIADCSTWPGRPVASWPPAEPGQPWQPPRGKDNARLIYEGSSTARCPACGRSVKWLASGNLVAHKVKGDEHCPGSGGIPAEDPALAAWLPVKRGADRARLPAQPQDLDGRGRDPRDPGRGPPGP
jgi:hypothetical protein